MTLFILDIDPVQAAQSLATQHVENYIKRLKFSFALAHNENSRKPTVFSPIVQELTYSVENYIWFSEFFTELRKLMKDDNIRVDDFKEEYLFNYIGVKFNGNKLLLSLEHENKSNEDIINLNRLQYIQKCIPYRRFIKGYPSWYIKLDNDIYKKYNTSLRRDFKIVYEDNRYRYYVADCFNQWVEVQDVPIEIDGFITTLLQNN